MVFISPQSSCRYPEAAILCLANLPFQLQTLTLFQMSGTLSLSLLNPHSTPTVIFSLCTMGPRRSLWNHGQQFKFQLDAYHVILSRSLHLCKSPFPPWKLEVIMPASWGCCKTSIARSGIQVTIMITEHNHLSCQQWINWNMFHFEREEELGL